MPAVAGDAAEISGERIGECSSPQTAVVAGIFAQRGTELLEDQSERRTINVAILQQAAESKAIADGGGKPQTSVAERASQAADG